MEEYVMLEDEELFDEEKVEEIDPYKDLPITVYKEFLNATSFIDNLNLRRDIKRCINFEAGVQWNMDEDLKDFPKVVLNVVKQIGKVRKSNVLQNEYAFLVNTSMSKDIRKVQDFLKHLHDDKVKLKRKDLKATNDTYTKGTGITYFYWDADSRDFLSKSGGKLKAENIDVRRFRVADPYIQDLQEQEWVTYVSRETIKSIKSKYGVEVESDAEEFTNLTENPFSTNEYEEELANVYTKFFRNFEGQVFFCIVTKDKVLKAPTPLNPFYQGSPEQAPNTMSLPDEKEQDVKIETEVFGKYPFASLVLDERDNCFYGIPGALEVLEAQKSINQHFSVYDKGIQDNVLGGYIHKKGILGEQELTTENGQILELDLMPGEDWRNVFGRIPTNPVPNDSLNYSGNLLGVLRQVSGASNVAIGQADYAGQSGKATQMLLERAKENTTDIAMLFNEYKREQAEILFLFAKFFYDNESFAIVKHGEQEDEVRPYTGDNKFNGNQYLGQDFTFGIKVGPAPAFSEFANIELLGMMVQSGQMPPEVYVQGLPEGQVSNKQELMKLLKNNSQKVIESLQKKLEESQEVMKQMANAYKATQKDRENIDVVVKENERIKSMLAELSANAIKIQQEAAKENIELTQDMQKLLSVIEKNGQSVEK